MIKQELIERKQILGCPVAKIQCISGLILLSFIILSVFRDDLSFNWILKNFSPISRDELMFSTKSASDLLLLYEEELSRVEKAAFRPSFHNRQLMLKLNLRSMATELFDYFKNNSKYKFHHLKISSLQSSKNINDLHSICDIYLTFHAKMLNMEEVRLIFLFQDTACSLSLTNTSDMISIDIHRTFSVDDIFRFTYQWSHSDKANFFFWPQWPITTTCLNSYLNNLTANGYGFSKLKSNSFRCPLRSVLIHSTSRELFTKEQNAISYWLDLQYKASIDQTFLNRTNKYLDSRRLAPFEIAKNSTVCSKQFQKWISKYQQWHENITFLINNRSMTFEEQRNRIIELDVRFLIYDTPTSGIADRMVHLISTYLVALLTNRLFVFDQNWPEFFDVMQSSLNYEQKLIIPWFSQLNFLNKNLSSNDRNYLALKTAHFSFDRHHTDYNYENSFPERILLFKGHTGGVVHTIKSDSSIYRKLLTIDLKINPDEIFGCLYHSLFTYRLSELVKRVPLTSTNEELGHSSQQILRTLLSPTFYPIGIQIRIGDGKMKEQNLNQSNFISYDKKNVENFMNFFGCAEDIISKRENIVDKCDQKAVSYLLSDDVQLRRSALRRWKFPLKYFQPFVNECRSDNNSLYILSSANPVLHIQTTKNVKLAFQLGMFDIFLFSLCEEHIISTWSGFGRFSAFASLKKRNIYSFVLNEKHSCRANGIPLTMSAYHWSGI